MLLLVEGELLDEKGLTQGVLQYMSAHLSSLTVSLPGVEVLMCSVFYLFWDEFDISSFSTKLTSLSRIHIQVLYVV